MPSLRLTARLRLAAPPPWALLLAAVGLALFTSLGRWQWHRAAEKRALAAAFTAGSEASAAGAAPLGAQSPGALPRYAVVSVEGRYDTQRQFLLDNVTRNGQAGYEVLTPLQLADGRWLLVNRGWLPIPSGGRQQVPAIVLADDGPRALAGRLDELPGPALASARTLPESLPGTTEAAPGRAAGWPRRVSYPATADLAAALGEALEPRQLLLDAAASGGYRRDWQPASSGMTPERHLAYAVQWWGLATLVLVLLVVMNLERSKDPA